MDESTMKRMDAKNFKEADTDWCIATAENRYNNIMNIGWVEIIDYCCQKSFQGVARSRIKELFLQEVVDPKIIAYEKNIGMIDLTDEVQQELEKYNYESR